MVLHNYAISFCGFHTAPYIYYVSFNTFECFKMHCNDSLHIFNISHECMKLCQLRENDFKLFNALAMIAN